LDTPTQKLYRWQHLSIPRPLRFPPWRSGYLSKLCLQSRLVPTPDKRPCKASVYFPSASSFPCARAQGDERSLRRVTAPQTIEVAKDGKYSYLHQPFPGRADSQLPSLKLPDQPTLAQAHITTLRQPTTMRCCSSPIAPRPNSSLCLYCARGASHNLK